MIIIIISVMCNSGQFYYTRLFSSSSLSVLCSKNFDVMKLAGTRYGETSVNVHLFLILNMKKPKFLNGHFCVIITTVCTNYPIAMIIDCTNYYYTSNLVFKLCFYSNLNDVWKKRQEKCHYLKGKKNSNVIFSYMMLKLIQIMGYD